MPGFKDFKSVLASKGIGGGFLELEPGENRIRIVSDFVDYVDVFTDKKTGEVKNLNKFMCWAINRKSGAVQPFTFGPMIFEGIGNLAVSSEYGFDGLPPYDMIISKTGSGLDTEYAVVAARNNTELTPEEVIAVEKAGDINVVIGRSVAKKGGIKPADLDLTEEDIPVVKDEDLPF